MIKFCVLLTENIVNYKSAKQSVRHFSVFGLKSAIKEQILADFWGWLKSDKGYPFKNAPFGAFFRWFPCPVGFCVGWRSRAGRTVFILFGVRKRNPNPPHDPKTPKTVMQCVMRE